MSRYRLKKRLSKVGDRVDDFIDEAEDTYDSFRDDVRRRAEDVRGRAQDARQRAEEAWGHRGDMAEDLADGLVSAGEYAASVVSSRFRSDPVGTIAIGAIAFWVISRLARR